MHRPVRVRAYQRTAAAHLPRFRTVLRPTGGLALSSTRVSLLCLAWNQGAGQGGRSGRGQTLASAAAQLGASWRASSPWVRVRDRCRCRCRYRRHRRGIRCSSTPPQWLVCRSGQRTTKTSMLGRHVHRRATTTRMTPTSDRRGHHQRTPRRAARSRAPRRQPTRNARQRSSSSSYTWRICLSVRCTRRATCTATW